MVLDLVGVPILRFSMVVGMDQELMASEERFGAYVEGLSEVIGRADRVEPYGFLIIEREAIPPSGPGWLAKRKALGIPKDYRPRGSADPSRTSRRKFNSDGETTPRRPAGASTTEMSVLSKRPVQPGEQETLMTQ
jgi:hypothetical protein